MKNDKKIPELKFNRILTYLNISIIIPITVYVSIIVGFREKFVSRTLIYTTIILLLIIIVIIIIYQSITNDILKEFQ